MPVASFEIHPLALENSRILKRVDEKPVWSIVCFFADKTVRKQGLIHELLRGAVAYAQKAGREVRGRVSHRHAVPQAGRPDPEQLQRVHGIASVFREFGFVETGRASDTQSIMRLTLK